MRKVVHQTGQRWFLLFLLHSSYAECALVRYAALTKSVQRNSVSLPPDQARVYQKRLLVRWHRQFCPCPCKASTSARSFRMSIHIEPSVTVFTKATITVSSSGSPSARTRSNRR
ncbi:hypothetical protein BJV78DRAFT_935160 [Lactifluus subvellereus]|nr:hypothetical protein BJV78DRAFT_935160 [Lactifluus subvellereus]